MNLSEHDSHDVSNNHLFELIFHRAPACIALLRGPDFTFEAVNPSYAAIAPGIPMLGQTVATVFPEGAPYVLPLLQEVLDSGDSFQADDQPINIGGHLGSPSETRYFSFSYTRVTDGNAFASPLILVLALDTTARKKAEEARTTAIADLKSQWRTFDAALSNTPDFVYNFDLQGKLSYVNSALLALWGISLGEALGRNFHDLGYPLDLANQLQRQVQQVITTKAPLRDQTPFTGPTGETRHYEYIFTPVFSSSGEVEAVTGSTRDITDRKEADEKERECQIQIREKARLESLGILAGGVAHDFNNLLVGILGNASLLVEVAPGNVRSLASEIVLAAERAAGLTKQMLAYSGKGRFILEVLDLNTLISTNQAILRASVTRSFTVEFNFCPEACPVEVDRAQMQQLLENLIVNASEAICTGAGKICIRTAHVAHRPSIFSAHLHAAVPAGSYVAIEVQDSGAGMVPETLNKIFDPFFTTKFTGRGLGLAAVLGIVKGHNGDIEVESRVGTGTLFRVLLPMALPGRLRLPKHSARDISVAGKSVLVVDDEMGVCKMAKVALQRAGFGVSVAAGGMEALTILQDDPCISLVILDLTMPGMTGEQTLPHIKALRPEIPVVLSSGLSESDVEDRYASAGLAGFLRKPYTSSALTAKVTQILKAQECCKST